ncbi:MarR family transcriptional regulator [Alicyclobacillus suci]|uniref:MarR family transcriptional regulator n=1 Tax=Alicyclobacillus suci TaxID=2816080 RepID=UPI001A8C40E4|nr:MarR family transcriptional regulator [Alicyclobacillus suci]
MVLPDEVARMWEVVVHHLEQEKDRNVARLMEAFSEKQFGLTDGYQLSEIHVIDLIGNMENPNVTAIAERMHMTRGAISKIASKLKQRGDIESFQLPDNQKNLYFRLTRRGQRIRRLHADIHAQAEKRVVNFFSRYAPEELQVIQTFLSDVSKHIEDMLVE